MLFQTVSSSQGTSTNRSSQSNSVVVEQSSTSVGIQKSKNKKQKTNERKSGENSSTMAGPSNMDIQMAASTSSIDVGEHFFVNLIGGIDRDQFLTNYWERKPLHISRQRPDIYNSLGISLASVDEMLRSNVVEFTKNLDITSYINGQRQTHNPGMNSKKKRNLFFFFSNCFCH